MNKSILITGARASGKTTKMKQILNELNFNYVFPTKQVDYTFYLEVFPGISNSNIKLLCYNDGYESIAKLTKIIEACHKQDIYVIASVPVDVNDLPHGLVSLCHIITPDEIIK